ncbi:sodium/hydrogen exchanger 9B1-like isoform X1 [Zerene cesonia]|uniref:sodium/hydrogen exchanger 9B1-like isoform X1 n=2 Tax=Zerene cesonia TaxID=33412 RepID=UPI0018E596B0|nr:sodium/hydrogen exchanger 9B1-like isoform X1 [Zerene cesonia]
MKENRQMFAVIDSDVYFIKEEEVKTPSDVIPTINIDSIDKEEERVKKKTWLKSATPAIVHYITLFIIGLCVWGTLWSAWGDGWSLNGNWFRIAIVGVVAWASGQVLQGITSLPPLLAALFTGIIARHIGFLDMRHHADIDIFLRKIYPVIILGKGSLAWNVNYMKRNWRQIILLGTVPWTTEVVVLTVCVHYFLGFPWLWGVLLGSIYASVSCPVTMPSVIKHGKLTKGAVEWPQLICTAGGLDTALSVGVYGITYTYIFTNEDSDVYRLVKAGLTLFVGAALGFVWGTLAKLVPDSRDYYVTELRVLFVLIGGLFGNYFTGAIGWGGTGGVAVLVCNATAASHWVKKGWKLNQNPAATVYRILWSGLEPLVFAYTGTFFVIHHSISETMLVGLGILFLCLTIRLLIAFMMCWNLKLKEKLYVCCTWIPKSVVEAVLCPLAISTIKLSQGSHSEELVYAEDLMRLVVQAIIITTPIGFLLTDKLGPLLLTASPKNIERDPKHYRRKSNSEPVNEI